MIEQVGYYHIPSLVYHDHNQIREKHITILPSLKIIKFEVIIKGLIIRSNLPSFEIAQK